MNVTLSREQMRLQKAKAQQLKHAQHVAREKAWLSEHPEIVETREREKQAEAEQRRKDWLESEANRKIIVQQVNKKKPSNAFAALLGDDDSTEDEAEPIKEPEPIKEQEPETVPEKVVQKSICGTRKSWADECDSDNDDA